MRGGPTTAASGPCKPPPVLAPAEAAAAEVVEENSGREQNERELGLRLGSKIQQLQQTTMPCRIVSS